MGAADTFDALDLTVYGLQFVGRGAGDVQQEVKVAGEVVAVGDVGVVDDGAAEAVVVLGCSKLTSMKAVTSKPSFLLSTFTS